MVEEAWRTANVIADGCEGAKKGRSVRWIFVGRVLVLVEKGAAVAAEALGTMRPGWKRTVKARAGRSALEESIAADLLW